METRRPLNPFDQTMLALNEAMLQAANSGFETITQFHLEGRLNPGAIREALDTLQIRFPLLTARLVKERRKFYWDWAEKSSIPLEIAPVKNDIEIQSYTETLLSRARDLWKESSVDFHILQLPDGNDILLCRCNHALLDHQAAMKVYEELGRLLSNPDELSPVEYEDLILRYRKQHTSEERWKALLVSVQALIETNKRGLPRNLVETPHIEKTAKNTPWQSVLLHQFNEDETRQLQDYFGKVSRFPSPSMTILGSAFATVSKLLPDSKADDHYRTGLGVELASLDPKKPNLQNLSSVMFISIRQDELQDRQQRVDVLNQGIRDLVACRRELGVLQGASIFTWFHSLVRGVVKNLVFGKISFWYAWFAPPSGFDNGLGNTPIRDIQFFGPAWSPFGATLLATQYGNKISLQLTYIPGLISATRAEAFLQGLSNELLEAAAAG